MGKYKLTNPSTGETKTVDWDGDKPPTQADALKFFQPQDESPSVGDVLSQPGASALKGIGQLGSNPVAGLANIGTGLMGALALPFSLADMGLRHIPAIGKPLADAVALPFMAASEAVRGGERLIQGGIDAVGIPKSVQNLGLSDENANEAAQAISQLNEGMAQGLVGAGLAKGGKGVLPKTQKNLSGEKVQTSPTAQIDPIVEKVSSALKVAKPLREQTEILYTKERGKRIAQAQKVFETPQGEKSHFQAKSKLGGELPKAEFEPIRDKITQPDVDHLHNSVITSKRLSPYEKIAAGDALNKLFTQEGTSIPQQSQIALLERVFGSEFTKEIVNKRGAWENVKKNAVDLANTPRTLMSSFDMSIPLRQTVIQIGSHPIKTLGAWKEMHKSFFSERAFKEVFDDIHSRENAPLYDRFKLDIIDPQEIHGSLIKREEAFMSRLAERIPIAGSIVKASSRAAHVMVNKVRADMFDSHVAEYKKMGLDPSRTPSEYKALADWMNISTGRGSFGRFTQYAPVLNGIIFSPRLLASRFQAIGVFNPITYWGKPKAARMIAMKDMVKFISSGTALLTAAGLGGADVELDPRSSDFGKIRIGNTRLDPWGGFQQVARFVANLSMGERKTSSGRIQETPRSDIIIRFMESKLNPQTGFAWGLLKGKSFNGEDFQVGSEATQRLSPMYLQDLYDAIQEGNDPVLDALKTSPGFYGVGVSTYERRAKAPKKVR